jgi:nucleotide-binding universal stress UspA family protein
MMAHIQQPGGAKMYRKILVPVDGSEASQCGLREAIKLAKSTGAKLHIVHVVDQLLFEPGFISREPYDLLLESLRLDGQKILEGAKSATRDAGVEFVAELIETVGGRVSSLILDAARHAHADLIIMGTHGKRGLKRLLMGSDAELVLRSATVPVLFVRPKTESDERLTSA